VSWMSQRLLAVSSASTGRRTTIAAILRSPIFRSDVLHALSNVQAAAASFDDVLANVLLPARIAGFEDCAWLFGSNALNHGLSRQEIAEAAYLYRLVRSMSEPTVLELGRYKGGTTFLLAAAGAHVVSLELREPHPGSDDELRGALDRFGLLDRVELVLAASDAFEIVNGTAFDLVFIDAVLEYEYVSREVERFWAAIPDGGSLILRDGSPYPATDVRAVLTVSMVRAAADLGGRADAERISETPGTYAHFVKRASRA
jgi:predicted O-methyltransferase YrrM